MSDLWRRLPRLRRRNSGPSPRDWRPRIAAALRGLADELAALPEEGWSQRTLSPGHRGTVEDVVADLLARLTAPGVLRRRRSSGPTGAHEELVERLRAAADRADAGEGPHGLPALAAVVQCGYDVTVALELPDPVDPETSLAVARARVSSADPELRALLRGRALVAEDAGWRIGAGPEIRGSAAVLVSWLGGRPVVPVFPPRGRS